MKRLLGSTLLTLALLLSLTATAFAASAFQDVPDTHWASSYIQTAYEKGWVNGMTASTYAPSGTLTRAQFLKMVTAAFYPGEPEKMPEPDGAAWHYIYWAAAEEHGLTKGTPMTDSFDLNTSISRYDMAQTIANTLADKGISASGADYSRDIQDWSSIPKNYQDAVTLSYVSGVLNGKNGKFAGQDSMTRAEAAAVLCRMDSEINPKQTQTPPSTQTPSTQTPGTQTPAAQTPSSQTPATAASDPEEFAAEVVRLVNVERAKEGLSPLGTFDSLTEAAQIRAPELITLFSHDRPNGTKCFTALDATGASKNAYTSGENIAAGQSTPAAVMESWMNSPGHKANILNKNFTHIGVAYVKGGSYGCCWVQMFVGTNSVPGNTTAQTPTTQQPTTQTPITQTPTTQTPSTQQPTTQTPAAQTPTTQQPTTQKPGTQTPSTQTPTTQTPSAAPEELAAEVVRLVNVERAKEGLASLGTYDSLTKAAQIRAPELPTLFSHTRPDGSTCFTALDQTGAKTGAYTYGENIAAGSATAAGAMEQWMNSSGHRANILNKDFTHIGVAYVKSSSGYGHYWVQMFIGTNKVPGSTATQTPSTQQPTTQTPGTQTPGTQQPTTQTPSTQTPGAQESDDERRTSTYLAKKVSLSCLARYNMPSDSFSTTELYIYKTSDFYGKDYTVSWTVDDPSVLRLEEITSNSGNPAVRFYGRGVEGKARITCTVTASDGMTATQFCDVTVTD